MTEITIEELKKLIDEGKIKPDEGMFIIKVINEPEKLTLKKLLKKAKKELNNIDFLSKYSDYYLPIRDKKNKNEQEN